MATNRFAEFKWTDAEISKSLTRADALALLDQFSLSLTKRAYALQSAEPTAAAVVGHIATALQDLRLELYQRMQFEMKAKTPNTDVMAVYGDAGDVRVNLKPYDGTGTSQLKAIGQQMLRAAWRAGFKR